MTAAASPPDEKKAEPARSVGAQEVVGADGFLDEVRALTDGRGADLVLDPVGGDRFPASFRALRRGGGASSWDSRSGTPRPSR
ncbi:zinc-binding dehydrogenase [Nocardiopsis sp. NRRL B-16309]|uniref:zinc-binding dehydrogenase n=1 Tax=Nocardiopsis sp. NRRL B-16309 TaxID=1519494 RepID=UPI000AAD809A|nr:zinc-binding dehydrogenase [Nocardiopsis sp. NRRL B-16309]